MNTGRTTRGLRQHGLSYDAIALSFLIAWIEVVYSGDVQLIPSDGAYHLTTILFPLSTLGVGIGCIAQGIAFRKTHALLFKPAWVMSFAVAGCLCTLGVAAGGSIPLALYALLSFLVGICTTPLTMLWALKATEVDSRNTIISFAGAQILAALIYAFVVNMAAPVGSAFPVIITCALLPLAAGTLYVQPACPIGKEPVEARMPHGLWRLIVSFAAMAFVCLTVRAYYPNLLGFNEFFAMRYLTAIAIIGAMSLLVAVAAAVSRNAEYGSIGYNLFLLLTLALVAVPFFGFGSVASVVLATAILALCLLVACTVLMRISFKSGADSLRVFGLGYGFTILGCCLGATFGQSLFVMSIPTETVTCIGSALTLVIVAVAFFLMPRKDMDELMRPTQFERASAQLDDNVEGESVQTIRVAWSKKGEEAESERDASDNDVERTPYFKIHCKQLASEYGLSPRETEIMFLLAKGRDAQALADELFISYNTARTHIRHIYDKLDVHSRHEFFHLVNDSFIEK